MVATMDEDHRELRLVPVDEVLDALQAEASLLLAGVPSLAAALLADRRAEVDR
jgi:hypothetical protein